MNDSGGKLTDGCGMAETLVFFVNGKKIEVRQPDPNETLLRYLREKLHLTGAKDACGEGGCGSCTVMLSSLDRTSKKISHYAVNACITPLCAIHGLAVTTVEGIGGSARARLHPVQERIVKYHGTQCGYCTPGFVMSMYTLLRNNPTPTEQEVHECIRGNLCRCTGYRPIIEGFKTFAQEFKCPLGEQCCQNTLATDLPPENIADHHQLSSPFNETQEPTFPAELQVTDRYDKQCLHFQRGGNVWLRPTSLEELQALMQQYENHVLVAGGTLLSSVRARPVKELVIIHLNAVPEMCAYTLGETNIQVGSSVTISQLQAILMEAIDGTRHLDSRTRGINAVLSAIKHFAATQIRNMGTLGGSVAGGSGQSDLIPILMTLGCSMDILSREGRTLTSMDQALNRGEAILSITIPYTTEHEYAYFLEHSLRPDLDAAIVNVAMKVSFKPKSTIVHEIDTRFGGLCKKITKLSSTRVLIGSVISPAEMTNFLPSLEKEVDNLLLREETSTRQYKAAMVCGMFFKLSILAFVDRTKTDPQEEKLPLELESVTESLTKAQFKYSQAFEVSPSCLDPVGKPLPHVSAKQQATGEAQYVGDVSPSKTEVHVALVTSDRPHAKILNVDASECLEHEGVLDFLTHKDVPGSNLLSSTSIKDEEIFASTEVSCVGQVIGAVLATTKTRAKEAARLVQIEYEELPAILDIRQAIQEKSFHSPDYTYEQGSVSDGFANSDHIIEDEFELGGQEHFYMETHGAICTPHDGGIAMNIIASVQCPDLIQMKVSEALGVPANHVSCSTVRVGGAFGGKDSRGWLAVVVGAIGAYKHGRPTRCILDRATDMLVTGGRHPMLVKYKVGANAHGKILALDLKVFLNGGHTVDLSSAVAECCAYKFDNCYRIPAVSLTVTPCKTNYPSNTSCRAAGSMQGILICEQWLSHLAEVVDLPQDQIREINFYREGDTMAFNMTAENCMLQKSWQDLKRECSYEQRVESVRDFNLHNRFKKRGIAVCPVRYGFPLSPVVLDQAGAIVNIYKDGTVLVSHGGVEVGQGLHTKMIQIASRVLGVPSGSIFISQTSTDLVPNASPTAGSSSSDLNGMAVLKACQLLKDRIQPYRDAKPTGTMQDWAQAAYFDRVSLSASGFYKHPQEQLYDWGSGKGVSHVYHSYSVACTEVEIDVLTGDHIVRRTDIMLDAGQSLNPAIDIGQVEGGFIMGYGLCLLEELKYDANGKLLTTGPGAYKIPSVSTVPGEFNVYILRESKNPKAIYSSKGTGEPGMILATSVYLAVQDAIIATRKEAGLGEHVTFGTPLTSRKIKMACGPQLYR